MPIHDNAQRLTAITAADESAFAVSLSAYDALDVVGGLLKFPVASAGGGGGKNPPLPTHAAHHSGGGQMYFFDAPPTSLAEAAALAASLVFWALGEQA